MNSKTTQEYHEELTQVPLEKVWEVVKGYFPINAQELAKRVCPPLLKRFKNGERGDIVKVFQFVDTYSPLIDFYDHDLYQVLSNDFKISHFVDLAHCMPNWWEHGYTSHLNMPSERLHAFRLLSQLASVCPLEELESLERIKELKPLPGYENIFISRFWNIAGLWMARSVTDDQKLKLSLTQMQGWLDAYPEVSQKLSRHWSSLGAFSELASPESIKSLLTFYRDNQIKITQDFWKLLPLEDGSSIAQRFQAVYNRIDAISDAAGLEEKIKNNAASILWEELGDLIKKSPDEDKKGFSLAKTWSAWCLLPAEKKPGEFPIAEIFLNGWVDRNQISDWFVVANDQVDLSTLIRDVKSESVLQELLSDENIALLPVHTDYKFKETLLLVICEHAHDKDQNWLGPIGGRWLAAQIQEWANSDENQRISSAGFLEDAVPKTKERRASLSRPMPSTLKIWEESEKGYWGNEAQNAIIKAMLKGNRAKFFAFYKEVCSKLKEPHNAGFILKARDMLMEQGEDFCSLDEKKDFLTYMSQVKKLDWDLRLGEIPFEKSHWFAEWVRRDPQEKEEERSSLTVSCPVWMKGLENYELNKTLMASVKKPKFEISQEPLLNKNEHRF